MEQAAKDNGVTMKPFALHDLGGAAHDEGNVLELLSPELRVRTIALWTIWVGFGFSYYGVILFISRIFSVRSPLLDGYCSAF